MRNDHPAGADHNDRTEGHGGGVTANGSETNSTVYQRGDTQTQRQQHKNNQTTHATQKSGRRTKAAIRIASLNMCGKGTLSRNTSGEDKWNSLNQIAREKKIGIIALQETHLTDPDIETIHRLYGRRLQVFHSPSERASTAQGVAIVLNREIVDTKNVQVRTLVQGRAIQIDMNWHNEKRISILNIYAPNDNTENTNFWNTLKEKLNDRNHKKPQVILGDFNNVEDALDRLPAREDATNKIDALKQFLQTMHMVDGWRITEPHTIAFTFPQQGSQSKARLDRIYTTNNILQSSSDWRIETTAIKTDHHMISAKISSQEAPHIGKGRWTMPLNLLDDRTYVTKIMEIGQLIETEARKIETQQTRTEEKNPQTLLRDFKQKATKLARDTLKKRIPKTNQRIKVLEKQISELKNHQEFPDNAKMRKEHDALQNKLIDIERREHNRTKSEVATRYILNAEIPSKYWSTINKEQKPRDILYSLRKLNSDPPEYEKRSDKMAELAKEYHDKLQNEYQTTSTSGNSEETIKEVINSITTKTTGKQKEELSEQTTTTDIKEAIRKTKKGKAAGLDGIPYEFWDTLRKTHESTNTKNKPTFNCLELLRMAYNDIEKHGTSNKTGFAEGWMCPLYKKGDRREAANYRPITLLNTDYKIYTRILTTKLAPAAQTLIHANQAGFIPGRHIEDQTQTCRTLIDYAEAMEENGVIIALDQEKAYDKIDHKYLWLVLKAFGLPEKFIQTIKHLYQNATTVVIINGETSSPFRITRGVRQGDPLSCLLFNLAIEPLANMLRQSELKGFKIPGLADRLIASLFADDTSTFLAHTDKWSELWTILEKWCTASRAKFNGSKTEVIPIGSPEYRKEVINTRRINPPDQTEDKIPETIHIAKDGEAVRILGAWLGNKIDEAGIWTPALTKIDKFLERWGKCHPSLKGKKHITQMGPGGISQYLTKVQGMPKTIERSLTSTIREFIWDGKKPAIAMSTLYKKQEEGGIGLLDIESRNEAIEMMWLKKYLDLSQNRPAWAYIVDAILNKHVTKNSGAIRPEAQINSFLQTWNPSTTGKTNLPKYLKKLITTAKKQRVSFAAIKLEKHLMKQLPIWYHLGAETKLKKLNNTPISDCLRRNHKVKTVADTLHAAEHQGGYNPPENNCECFKCTTDRTNHCKHPHTCHEAAKKLISTIHPKWNPTLETPNDGLTLTRHRKKKNEEAKAKGGQIIFNPSVTERNDLSAGFRAWIDPNMLEQPPALRIPTGQQITEESTTIYIEGGKDEKHQNSERSIKTHPIGISFHKQGDPRNTIVSPAETKETENAKELGQIIATIKATDSTPGDAPLHLIYRSKYMPTALSSKLQQWEDIGWLDVPHAEYLRTLISKLRKRCAVTTVKTANETKEWESLNAAKDQIQTWTPDNIEQTEKIKAHPTTEFNITGARMSTLTQAIAYKMIRKCKPIPNRERTRKNIENTLKHINTGQEKDITESTIWRGLQHQDFSRKIADFLWKCAHGAQKCGEYWENIPGYEDRKTCAKCDKTDSMSHILTECDTRGQKIIWNLARQIWNKKNLPWPQITLEEILAAGCKTWREPGKKRKREADTRFWRILISESAHLIWRLRCERVINHEDEENWDHSEQEITNRWLTAMNNRLHLDQTSARRKFQGQGPTPETVENTWEKTLENESSLPKRWTRRRVLVGMAEVEYKEHPD